MRPLSLPRTPRPLVISCAEVTHTCRCCCFARHICGETTHSRTAGNNSMCQTRIRCWLPFIIVNWNGVPRSGICFPCFWWSGYSYFVRPNAPPTKPLRVRHDVSQKRFCIQTHSAELFVPHGQHSPSKMAVDIYPDSRRCSLIRLPLQAKGVRDPTLRVVPFLADTANAVQQDGCVTIRFRNAISGEHLDSRMRDLGVYSTIARAFDFLESKVCVGGHYESYVQPVPPSTLATTFKELKETPESDGALLIQYVTSPLPCRTACGGPSRAGLSVFFDL
jgi:hypothetical protein